MNRWCYPSACGFGRYLPQVLGRQWQGKDDESGTESCWGFLLFMTHGDCAFLTRAGLSPPEKLREHVFSHGLCSCGECVPVGIQHTIAHWPAQR
jgi:hypothetical protein